MWVRQQSNAIMQPELRRRLRITTHDGWRLLYADEPAAKGEILKDFEAISRAARKALDTWLGIDPLELLAQVQSGFTKQGQTDRPDYFQTVGGGVVLARWLRILQPLVNAPMSGGIDPSWQQLPPDAFEEIIFFGWHRELALTQHSPFYGTSNDMRAKGQPKGTPIKS
jgi:hypothetical protein